MLEPIFGATGAVIAQYVLTLIIILGLVVLVVWLVRRYAVGGLGTSVRGRLPRLAIVDALVVDNRHRLVLVRRDNVEHLVLIGGSTDLLVEPNIVRTRVAQRPGQPGQPAAAPQPTASQPARASAPAAVPPPPPPAAAAPSRAAPPPPPEPSENAIPFQPRPQRSAAGAARAARIASRPSIRPAEAADLVAPREPMLRRPMAEPESPLSEEPELAAVFPTRPARVVEPPAPEPEPEAEPAYPAMEDESPSTVPDIEPPPMTPVPASAFAPPRHRPVPERASAEEDVAQAVADVEPEEPDAPSAPAPKVSDLEKEMARLLGEISSSRSS